MTPAWLEAKLGAERFAELRARRSMTECIELPARSKSGVPLILVRSGRSMEVVACAPGIAHVHTHIQVYGFDGLEPATPTVDLVCHPCAIAVRIEYSEGGKLWGSLEDEWKKFIGFHVDCDRGQAWAKMCTPGYAIVETRDLRQPVNAPQSSGPGA